MSWIKSWSKLSFLLMTKVFWFLVKTVFTWNQDCPLSGKNWLKNHMFFPTKFTSKLMTFRLFYVKLFFKLKREIDTLVTLFQTRIRLLWMICFEITRCVKCDIGKFCLHFHATLHGILRRLGTENSCFRCMFILCLWFINEALITLLEVGLIIKRKILIWRKNLNWRQKMKTIRKLTIWKHNSTFQEISKILIKCQFEEKVAILVSSLKIEF